MKPLSAEKAVALNHEQAIAVKELQIVLEKCRKLQVKIMCDTWMSSLTAINGELINDFDIPSVEGIDLACWAREISKIDLVYDSCYNGPYAEFSVPVFDDTI